MNTTLVSNLSFLIVGLCNAVGSYRNWRKTGENSAKLFSLFGILYAVSGFLGAVTFFPWFARHTDYVLIIVIAGRLVGGVGTLVAIKAFALYLNARRKTKGIKPVVTRRRKITLFLLYLIIGLGIIVSSAVTIIHWGKVYHHHISIKTGN